MVAILSPPLRLAQSKVIWQESGQLHACWCDDTYGRTWRRTVYWAIHAVWWATRRWTVALAA